MRKEPRGEQRNDKNMCTAKSSGNGNGSRTGVEVARSVGRKTIRREKDMEVEEYRWGWFVCWW